MDEDQLFRSAASGSAEALYNLANIAAANFLQGIPEAIGGAEIFLRLAAASDPTYRLELAGFLLSRGACLRQEGEIERGDILRWQAIELLRDVVAEGDADSIQFLALSLQEIADEGSEPAAVELNRLMASLAPETAAEVAAKVSLLIEAAEDQLRANEEKAQ